MATPRGTYVRIRLLPDQRSRLSELVKASGQTETLFIARAVEMALAEPELSPEGLGHLRAENKALRAELAELQRQVEKLTTRVQTDWQAAVQARAEERRAQAEQPSPPERRWSLFGRKKAE